VAKPSKRATRDEPEDRAASLARYAKAVGVSPEQFLADELEARRAILARFARTGGIVSDRRAKERAEEMVWRGLQAEHLGPELAAWDRANRADPMVELAEELDDQREAAKIDEALAGWTDNRGRSHLFPRQEG
jgi:hypothetical protein